MQDFLKTKTERKEAFQQHDLTVADPIRLVCSNFIKLLNCWQESCGSERKLDNTKDVKLINISNGATQNGTSQTLWDLGWKTIP